MWIDASGNWHVLYHLTDGPDPGGHACSPDGRVWSNISVAYTDQRPVGNSTVSYGAERPKLLFNGSTPTHLYNGGSKADPFTIVSPLRRR